ncbi:hypothetical protein AB1Y20_016821 [Prymnesium parvum]|uniref:RRM domain-containing protein n=1 Tax=Prymnesium parvum TaxID=97485 RepID=A0AB34IDH1_PRYPA|mmetsp:Transcript_48418/g.119995  ORF Transcript_48418/g.119995 Transcript_48418/m.119995 type:complete len:95 (-) Transcript_48418:337-621(-)
MGRDIETQSEYVLLVQNISDKTRRSDLEYEFDKAGPVRYIARIRDDETLIEFKHRKDAAWAYRNLDRLELDGSTLRVHWAEKADFEDFGWEWFE